MKSLIFFTFICACGALPHPFIADTPEVQAERQRFYQLYNKAAEAAAAAPDTNVYTTGKSHSQYHHISQPKAYKSYTPQVQAYQSYTPNTGSIHRFSAPQTFHQADPHYTPKWTGPLASDIPAGLPGSVSQVSNTPEVEAAIANFNKAYSAAAQITRSAAPQPNTYQQGHYSQAPQQNRYQGHYSQAPQQNRYQGHYSQAPNYQPKWTGPVAATIPAGLPGSAPQVADTAEVQAARAYFGQAYQQQLNSVLG